MTKEKIMEAIEVMPNAKVIKLWNECIRDNDYSDNEVFFNNRVFFNEMFDSAYDAVLSVTYGDWKERDEYVVFDSHKNAQSFTSWEDMNSPIDADVLADWLFENQEKAKEICFNEDEEEEAP